MTKKCEGCSEFYAVDGRTCASQLTSTLRVSKNITLTCPCVNCLVKPMCSRSCEKFSEYAEACINQFRKEMKDELAGARERLKL